MIPSGWEPSLRETPTEAALQGPMIDQHEAFCRRDTRRRIGFTAPNGGRISPVGQSLTGRSPRREQGEAPYKTSDLGSATDSCQTHSGERQHVIQSVVCR